MGGGSEEITYEDAWLRKWRLGIRTLMSKTIWKRKDEKMRTTQQVLLAVHTDECDDITPPWL